MIYQLYQKLFSLRTLSVLLLGVLFVFNSLFIVPKNVLAANTPLDTEKEYIVQLQKNDPTILASYGANVVPRFLFSSDPDLQFIYSFHSTRTLYDLKQSLAAESIYIEESKQFSTESVTVTPLLSTNDPGFTRNDRDIDKQWGLVKANFREAWVKTKGSSRTVVAILDTGIDATHEDLTAVNFVKGYNFITDTPISRGENSDDNGHGTIVAGIVGAKTNNGKGIAGTNWAITLMAVKALNAKGSGTAADISEAIVWAADNGADIINLSVGGVGFGHHTTLANSITHAFEKDVVIVAAAGNDVAVTGGDLDIQPVFPICNDNGVNMIIGVAASDHNDLKPAFSNFGLSCVDVVAPGKRILSTTNHDPLTGGLAQNAYAYASGTSMSVPYVSGQAALLRTLFPDATNRQIRDRIISTAENVDALNLTQCNGGSCKGKLGAGRIDVAKSLEEEIATVKIEENDVVRVESTGKLYFISGGRRHLIIPFVNQQRFGGVEKKYVSNLTELELFPEGSLAEPLDGTLIKQPENSTVYQMDKGLKLPVTYQIFQLRKLSFGSIVAFSGVELSAWLTGNFLPPPDGTLVRTHGNQTVYWVVAGILHPVNNKFYTERGLNVFPVSFISEIDLNNFSKGEAYIL